MRVSEEIQVFIHFYGRMGIQPPVSSSEDYSTAMSKWAAHMQE